jgi:putative ABC transport system substrate-binding protein
MLDRRTFLRTLAASSCMTLETALAQRPPKIRRIGFLGNTPPIFPAFLEALNQLGYTPGKSVVFEARFAEGRDDRYPAFAKELVALDVDVIVAVSGAGAFAAKAATTTIPIVIAGVSDPVGRGLATSLAHPGANVTGVANLALELNSKRLEFLQQAVPKIARVVSVGNWDATVVGKLDEQDAAARATGLYVRRIEINAPSDFDNVMETIVRERPDALVLLPVALTFRLRKEFAEFALARRLPTIGWQRGQVLAGILMAYGADNDDVFRDAAGYVDKILKGANPSDLAIEQPTKIALTINLGTAKAIGLVFPQTLLLRADEVIQ